MKLVRRAFRN
ncbi:hypothetical protein MTR67_019037 [Solanum verrucosum]|uniref:Uncharacterized protein n=1 Tax=Solanum verrucosum TaxID=315347 RepID=A0AAF0QMX7_SOLVR|nr:hypothetical protein MTR67_019037 [Solanum verrucosum]